MSIRHIHIKNQEVKRKILLPSWFMLTISGYFFLLKFTIRK